MSAAAGFSAGFVADGVRGGTETSPVPVNQWVHLAVVLDPANRLLTTYLDGARAGQPLNIGITVAQLLEYQAFLGKLEAALRHQQEIVALRRGDAERRMAAWTDRRTHTRAMDRAVENLVEAEQEAGERRDQKALDDRNQRRR